MDSKEKDELPLENKNSYISSSSLGKKAPLLKPKLEDTFPSLLNLSSELTDPRTKNKIDSFTKEAPINNDFLKKASQILGLALNFFPTHEKALSNEEFQNLRKLNINTVVDIFKKNENLNINKDNKNEDSFDEADSYLDPSNPLSNINFEGVDDLNVDDENKDLEPIENTDFFLDENNCKEEVHKENEAEEEDEEGYNILFMLKKKLGKKKNNEKI